GEWRTDAEVGPPGRPWQRERFVMKQQESGVSATNDSWRDAGTAVTAPERRSPLEMDAGTFRALGHRLIDQVAAFLESVPRRPVTTDQSPSAVRDALG